MRLQTRLLLAYAYLVTLVLVGAAGAALGFHALGIRILSVLDENFESIRASMGMLDALERQDSAVLAALLQYDEARDNIDHSETAFFEALERARSNVTEADEPAILQMIEDRYERYRASREALLETPVDRPLARYEKDCFPSFESVKSGVRSLLELNQRVMMDADREAQEAATRRALGYAFLTALALVSMGFLSRNLRTHLVLRLEELRGVAESLGRGDTRRRAAEIPADELGFVARALNRLLDSQDELRGHLEAGQSRVRDVLYGLVSAQSPAALLGMQGELMLSTMDDETTARVERAADELEGRADDAATAPEPLRIDVEGRPFRFRLLIAGGGRRVGWLVRPETTDPA